MYQKELMSEVYWGFYTSKYNSFEKFIQEVIEYNKELGRNWVPNEIVLNCLEVTIQYSHTDTDEVNVNETNFDLVADNETGFTAGELLFKIHNQVVDKLKDENHQFFEGLVLLETDNGMNPDKPHYFIKQGE